MKQLFTVLILGCILLIAIQCKSPKSRCIQYVDSLQVDLGDRKLNVAVFDLKQETDIRYNTTLYDNRLVVINQKDSFYVFDTQCYKRDKAYEKRLNTQKLWLPFVMSDVLYGIDSLRQPYKFDSENDRWEKLSYDLPLNNSIPIFENDKYICYEFCNGEWGGLIFFYNKKTGRMTFTSAQCAVTVVENTDGYYLVSSLDHLSGHSDIKFIKDPDLFFDYPDSLINVKEEWKIFNYFNEFKSNPETYSHGVEEIYDKWEVIIVSAFTIQDKNYYLFKTDSINYTGERDRFVSYFGKLEKDSMVITQTFKYPLSFVNTIENKVINKKTIKSHYDNERPITLIFSDTDLIILKW